jgi:hypothetical protein
MVATKYFQDETIAKLNECRMGSASEAVKHLWQRCVPKSRLGITLPQPCLATGKLKGVVGVKTHTRPLSLRALALNKVRLQDTTRYLGAYLMIVC